MRHHSFTTVLIGLGIGSALTLVGVKLYSEYWHNRILENAQVHLSENFAAGKAPPRLTAPPVPGRRP
jgi:hypothetical protein